jgi:hypothetical protein
VVNGQSIKSIVESHGVGPTCEILAEELRDGQIKPQDFSFKELAESFCGHVWVQRLNPRNVERFSKATNVMEAGEGVDVSAFGDITGQIIFSKIQQGWMQAGMIGDQLFETVPTVFDGERIPGIGRITHTGSAIRPGMPYPELGFGEQYWDTPSTTKHGLIVSLTKEAIFFDRTSLVLRRAAEVGERLRYNKELRQLAVFAGVTVTIENEVFAGNNHKWNGTSYNTYQTGANLIGINSLASTPLIDWTTVNQMEQLFVNLLDPDTDLPINIVPDTMVVMPLNWHLANRIVKATNVRTSTPGFAVSGNPQQTDAPNPVANYSLLKSPLLRQLMVNSGLSTTQVDQYWWLGQPKKSFWYMENWPLTTVQAPPQNTEEFDRDIVMRWKSSERGTPWSADPRYIAQAHST